MVKIQTSSKQSHLFYALFLKMEPDRSMGFWQNTGSHIQENNTLYSYRLDNLRWGRAYDADCGESSYDLGNATFGKSANFDHATQPHFPEDIILEIDIIMAVGSSETWGTTRNSAGRRTEQEYVFQRHALISLMKFHSTREQVPGPLLYSDWRLLVQSEHVTILCHCTSKAAGQAICKLPLQQ